MAGPTRAPYHPRHHVFEQAHPFLGRVFWAFVSLGWVRPNWEGVGLILGFLRVLGCGGLGYGLWTGLLGLFDGRVDRLLVRAEEEKRVREVEM